MATEPVADDMKIYEEMRNYDWDSDQVYQGGLKAILGPNPSPASDLILHAQCFYFSRKTSTKVDFNGYKEYLESHSSKGPPSKAASSTSAQDQELSSSFNQTAQEPSPQSDLQPHYQPNPPTANMAVESQPADPTSLSGSTPAAGAQPGAPYPRSFAEIVALIQSGAPIPGIMEIDDTPRGLAASSPSVMPKRRKPWEKDVPEEVIQGRGPGTFGDARDRVIEQEYPDA